jgi:aspartyl-tRNA(Asn)/glutamyl-tRNA(Gln) amidotransferase subunit A
MQANALTHSAVSISPRLRGKALTNVARFARTRLGGIAIQRMFRTELGVAELASIPDSLRGDLPLDTRPHPGRAPRQFASENLPWPSGGWAPSSATLTQAYREGRLSPVEVIDAALAEARRLGDLVPTVGPILDYADEAARAEALESAKRWRAGRALGPLDGVPWAVKEQSAVRGLPCRAGTSFLDASPRTEDATAVARVRAAGAIAIGTTPMTEFGMTPNGANAMRRMPRNPHARGHSAGGSSTGSGVAVATGLVPFALGADGGGSIRIPSALNGVFGIKPTWGRVSRSGDISGGTLAHLGPLACSTVDLARALEAMSGHDRQDPQTFAAPVRSESGFTAALGRGVRGLTIGVPESEWKDASKHVQHAGKEALAALEREGARLVPLELSLAKHAPAMGVVIIACEARAALRAQWAEHADAMGPDLQVSFAALDAFSAIEYLETCRLREGLRRQLVAAFQDVDLVALPSTVDVAPKSSDRDMIQGFLDTKVIDGLCRYCFLGNLTGLPAASIPVGYDTFGLPIGLQLVGDAWDEATIFAASAHLERLQVAVAKRPKVTARLWE